MRSHVLILAAWIGVAMWSASARAASVPLVSDGSAKCCVVVIDDKVYGRLTPTKIKGIVDKHR